MGRPYFNKVLFSNRWSGADVREIFSIISG